MKQRVSYLAGRVTYDGEKFDLSESIADYFLVAQLSQLPGDIFFHKSKDWEDEREYRYVFDYDQNKPYYIYPNGFLLAGVKPHHIFIGYKMAKEDKEKLVEYCMTNRICLYEIKPNRQSPDTKDFNKKHLVCRDGSLANRKESYKAVLK